MSEVVVKKLCCCRCGCKAPVDNDMSDRCDYCLEWHDVEGLDEPEE